jgi:hypothetical protein
MLRNCGGLKWNSLSKAQKACGNGCDERNNGTAEHGTSPFPQRLNGETAVTNAE